jgi:hypothetical protein
MQPMKRCLSLSRDNIVDVGASRVGPSNMPIELPNGVRVIDTYSATFDETQRLMRSGRV